MGNLTDREIVILKEALKFILDRRRDYGHEREKLLSKIEGADRINVMPAEVSA